MKRTIILLMTFSLLHLLYSCKGRTQEAQDKMPVVTVTVSSLTKGDIENEVSFNGTSVYLTRNAVLSPIAGYITKTDIRYGDEVKKGQPLFEIQTRERKALHGDNETDADFGTVAVIASSEGFIEDLTVSEPGIYVAEGSQLCTILNNRDLMIKVSVPFEFHNNISAGGKCALYLPDNSVIGGTVSQILPLVDEASQTQIVLIRPEAGRSLPEKLNMIVKFPFERHLQTFLISRSSLMTDETQSQFWVMRVENGNMAIKVPVSRGIENDNIVEISSPALSVDDMIISDGAYGLPDSTVIEIAK